MAEGAGFEPAPFAIAEASFAEKRERNVKDFEETTRKDSFGWAEIGVR